MSIDLTEFDEIRAEVNKFIAKHGSPMPIAMEYDRIWELYDDVDNCGFREKRKRVKDWKHISDLYTDVMGESREFIKRSFSVFRSEYVRVMREDETYHEQEINLLNLLKALRDNLFLLEPFVSHEKYSSLNDLQKNIYNISDLFFDDLDVKRPAGDVEINEDLLSALKAKAGESGKPPSEPTPQPAHTEPEEDYGDGFFDDLEVKKPTAGVEINEDLLSALKAKAGESGKPPSEPSPEPAQTEPEEDYGDGFFDVLEAKKPTTKVEINEDLLSALQDQNGEVKKSKPKPAPSQAETKKSEGGFTRSEKSPTESSGGMFTIRSPEEKKADEERRADEKRRADEEDERWNREINEKVGIFFNILLVVGAGVGLFMAYNHSGLEGALTVAVLGPILFLFIVFVGEGDE